MIGMYITSPISPHTRDPPTTADYSPVVLSSEWPRVTRLCFILFFAVFGTTINGFFIASFFVDRILNKLGNVFLCCLGLADFIVTTIVMPVCAVILLSGQWETVEVCNVLQVMTETSTYSYSLLIMLTAGESYFRLCHTDAYEIYMAMRVHIVIPLIFIGSVTLGSIGVYMKLDYDYCERLHYGNNTYRWTTNILFHGIPWALTLYGLIATCITIRRRARLLVQYRRSLQYKRDYSISNLNTANFLVFVISWFPCILILFIDPGVPDSVFYTLTWIALLRSVFTTFFYGMMNPYFRRAFSHIFNYCFCKNNLSPSFNGRNRRALEYRPATGEVRVHILHQAVIGMPHRNAICETHEL
ncbi:melatonin receptor type 1A-A-like [Aricia agestis]|uniref:melatonin receptor type 1A-A-like n=1 Tax=Aricia agestis TaxID=91739 RepID=UPI001C20A2E6|nr:melatonin receptor type 1A-A-like [Aricia agestis]